MSQPLRDLVPIRLLLALALLTAIGAAQAQEADAAAPQYVGSATMGGEWHVPGSECEYGSDSKWQYGGTYWPTPLNDTASLDAKTRTGSGSIDWTFNCLGDTDSGHCSLTIPSPPPEHSGGYEDFNLKPAGGGRLRVEFQGDAEFDPGPGCHGSAFGGFGAEPFGFIPKEKIGDAKIVVPISGSFDFGEVEGHGSAQGTLTLTKISDLTADPGGPYTVRRGGKVALDGSGSIQRSRIQSYRWTFSRPQCPAGSGVTLAAGAAKTGRTASVVALCTMRVKLTVSDGDRTDSRSTTITVKARHPQKVRFHQPAQAFQSQNFRFQAGGWAFGFNRCSIEWAAHHDQDRTDHWLHPGPTAQGGTDPMTLREVADPGGPFDGAWYVASHHLKVTRTIIVNRKLLPGGEVYDENSAADMKKLLAAILDHERTHGNLVAEKMARGFDLPAKLERALAKNEDTLRNRTEFLIRQAETELKAATSEARVRARLSATWHDATVTLDLPTGGQHTVHLASAGGD